jgi:uncharacterized protein
MTAPWRAIGLFLLLIAGLSGIFWSLINATQTVNAAYIFGLIVDARCRRDPHVPHLGPTAAHSRPRDVERPICAYRLPHPDRLLLGGIARHLDLRLRRISEYRVRPENRRGFRFGWRPRLDSDRDVRLSAVAAATGEEIGWRGFLVPELAKILPFSGVALVSGLIWASWHYPITAIVYRDAGLPPCSGC